MGESTDDVPRPIRAASWLFLAIEVLIAAGALLGGPVRIVAGALDGDAAQIASGVVGLLLGGAFAGMAYAHWTSMHGGGERKA